MTVLIKGSVGGNKGKNDAEDVTKIRGLLARHYKWAGKIAAKGAIDGAMIKAIEQFQKTAAALAKPDGRVDPKGFTLTRLNMTSIPGPKHKVFRPVCWNVDDNITEATYTAAATTLDCEVAAIKAVAEVESRGGAFDNYGRPTILFERHKFRKFTSSKYDRSHSDISGSAGGYGKPSEQYPKLYRAAMLDEEAALKSASWGTFQIMGFNHSSAGYPTVVGFIDAMCADANKHVDAFVAFIKSNPTLKTAIKAKDWAKFAAGYNGADYAKNSYHTKMEAAYKKFSPKATKATK